MSQPISNPSQQSWPSPINSDWIPENLEQQVTDLITNKAHWYAQVPLVRAAVTFGTRAASATIEDPSLIPLQVVRNLGKCYAEMRDRIAASCPIDPEYGERIMLAVADTLCSAWSDEEKYQTTPDLRPSYETLQARLDPILLSAFEDLSESKLADLGYQIGRDLWPFNLPDSKSEKIQQHYIGTLATRALSLYEGTMGRELDLHSPALKEKSYGDSVIRGMKTAKLGNTLGIRTETSDFSATQLRQRLLALLPKRGHEADWMGCPLKEAQALGEEATAAMLWQSLGEFPNPFACEIKDLMKDLRVGFFELLRKQEVSPESWSLAIELAQAYALGLKNGHAKAQSRLQELGVSETQEPQNPQSSD